MEDNNKIEPTQIANISNIEFQDYMIPFTGAWLPSVDPILIGAENYQDLVNMRYKNDGSGLEGIQGYTKFNDNFIYTYQEIKSGIHFRTNRDDDSYIIVHANRTATGQGELFYSKSDVDSAEGVGVFEPDPIFYDTALNVNPRFSQGPAGVIAYCNQEDTIIWGGNEINVSTLLTLKESSNSTEQSYFVDINTQGWAFPVDKTETILNRQETDYFTYSTADRNGFLVFSTRKLKGIKVYIVSGQENTNAANTNTINVQTWTGSAFQIVSSIIDGTSKMTQTGTISFTSTHSYAKPMHYEERYLYAYLVKMTATSGTSACQIYQVTLDAKPYNINNVWDGIYRQCIQAQKFNASSSKYEDYTLHVQESSIEATPVGLFIGAMTANDHVILMFTEQMSAIQCNMLGSLVNTATNQLDTTDGIQYWDGDSWSNLTFVDKTLSSSGAGFNQTGLVYWSPPSDEEKITLFSTVGYAYKLSVDGTLSGSNNYDVTVDLIGGIPAVKTIEKYKFPAVYKNRLMLCGYVEGNQGNRIDYSLDNAPDVFNGELTSDNGGQSIYVGSIEELTAATQLYNRFGSNIYNIFIILKNNETWLMSGDDPSTFQLYLISSNIGCPAPDTLTTAEVGFGNKEQIERNVALWLSHQGPVLFDGAVISRIKGIENYFDSTSSTSINFDYLNICKSWFDSSRQEWNLRIPTGTSTTLDTWLVYNINLQKWFKKYVGTNQQILCGIPAITTSGNRYVYGGSDDGRLYLLENGTSWDSADIDYTIQTGDFFPTKNQWDISLLRRLKIIVKRLSEQGVVLQIYIKINTEPFSIDAFSFYDYTNGFSFYDVDTGSTDSGLAGFYWADVGQNPISINLNAGTQRIIKQNVDLNQIAWSFSLTFKFSSNSIYKGFEPMMWGFQYQFTRKDF